MVFACQTPGGAELCFEGGVCAPDGLGCICPPGWEYDFSFWHDKNCVMPSNGYLINFLVCSAAVALGLLWIASGFRRTKKNVRKMAILTAINLASLWAISVGTYVQSGWYEVASIFHMIQLLVFCATLYILVMMIVRPVFVMLPSKGRRIIIFVQFIAAAATITQAVPILIMTVTAHDDSLIDLYNSSATSFMLALPILMHICFAITWIATSNLKAQLASLWIPDQAGDGKLNSAKGSVETARVVAKLDRLRAMVKSHLHDPLLGLPWPLAHIVLGSAPWHYISLWIGFSFQFILFAMTSLHIFMKQDSQSSSNSSSAMAKLHRSLKSGNNTGGGSSEVAVVAVAGESTAGSSTGG